MTLPNPGDLVSFERKRLRIVDHNDVMFFQMKPKGIFQNYLLVDKRFVIGKLNLRTLQRVVNLLGPAKKLRRCAEL
jgi:hypothetical protein